MNLIQDAESPNPLLFAGDAHNALNSNFQFTDPTTWFTPVVDTATNIGKFSVAAVASGVEGIWNSGAMIANAMGASIDNIHTADMLAKMDSSLSEYYLNNQQSVDVAGFVLSSFVPGTLGVKVVNAGAKVLNAAQYTGKLGGLVRATTGLLDSEAGAALIQANAKAIASSETTLSLINANTLKSFGTAFAKNALESAVFETAAVVSLQGSNFVKENTWQDLATNAATGMMLGGALGGAFESLGIYGKLKKAIGAEKAAANPDRFVEAIAPTVHASDAIILRATQLEEKLAAPELSKYAQHTVESLRLDIAKQAKELGGEATGRALQDTLTGASSREISERLLNVSKVKHISDVPEGARTVMKLFGEDAGEVVSLAKGEKLPLSLGDMFKSAEEAQAAARIAAKKITESTSVIGMDVADVELRHAAFRDYVKELPKGSDISKYDIPALEWAVINKPEGISVAGMPLKNYTDSQLTNLLQESKLAVAEQNVLLGKSVEEAAQISNIPVKFLRGEADQLPEEWFAAQNAQVRYEAKMKAAGLPADPNVLYRTKYGVLEFDAAKVIDTNKDILPYQIAEMRNAEAFFAMRTELSAVMDKDILAQLPEYRTQEILRDIHSQRVGSTFFGTASAVEGTAAKAERIGQIEALATNRRLETLDKDILRDAVALRNNKSAAIEFEAIMQEANRTTTRYIPQVDKAGKGYLISAAEDLVGRSVDEIIASAKGDIQTGARAVIPVQNVEAFNALKTHISLMDDHFKSYGAIAAARGESVKHIEESMGTLYGIKPDPKRYQHVAFVRDNNLIENAAGQMTMLHATSAQELEALMDSVRKLGSRYDVFDKKSGEIFHQLAEDYDRSKTLWRSSMDSTLERKGINSKFFQSTDANTIVDDWISFHRASVANKTRAEFAAHYEEAFSVMRSLGEEYARTAGSKYGTSIETWLSAQDKNPAFDFIKTSLNISRRGEYPVWDSFNTLLSKGFSSAWNGLSKVWEKTPSSQGLEEISKELDKYGAKTAYNDAALEIFRNHRAGGAELQKFVSAVNGALGFLTLRMDPLNALNNMLGANVLLGTEARAQISALKLEGIGNISSPGKLIWNAQREFFSETGKEKLAEFIAKGIVPEKGVSAIQKLLDDAALTGSETAAELGKRRARIAQATSELMKGAEKWSGNLMAEANTRYVSARVAEEIGKARGFSGTELDTFVGGFVNRVNGNLLASQRPTLFQGPAGQAIGLFQSYQFNMMQNLFRHVAEGRGKDAAMMMGLQSTLYGAKSLPGFDYINNSIIGMASGNQEHRDLYDAAYGALGKSGAEALLYGLPSNLLGVGLFSRGDTNPRNLAIIPSSLSEVPVIGATLQMYKNAMDTARNISGGAGIANSILMGIEHNGVSRPLAGLAQTARAFTSETGQSYSTTGKGTPIGTSDLMSFANAIRIAGGKPFDEAIANDKIYRISYFTASDRAKLLQVAETAKVAFGGRQTVSPDQMEQILEAYVKAGGNQRNFNAWATKQMISANTPTAEALIAKLKQDKSQKLQQMLGGTLPEGFD